MEFGFALIVPHFSLLKFFLKVLYFLILPEHTVERFLNFKRKFWSFIESLNVQKKKKLDFLKNEQLFKVFKFIKLWDLVSL